MSEEESSQAPSTKGHDEHYRLGGRPPLRTILILSVGPILSQVANALYGIVDTMWVGRAIGTKGITSMSTYGTLDSMGRAFGFFLMVAASSKSSQLYGQGKQAEVAQVMADLLRIALIFGCVVPAIIIPIAKPVATWFGAPPEIITMGFRYIVILSACSVISCIYQCLGGFLQGEGRSIVVGIANVISMVLNAVMFDPILLYYTDMKLGAPALGTILSELLPCIVILYLYYSGKFTLKPRLSDLFRRFSPHTVPAMKVGLSQLVAMLSVSLPSIFLQKWTGMASADHDEYNAAMAGHYIVFRFAMITMSVIIAINIGYLAPASYAYGSQQVKRWLWLTCHAAWINFVWGTICFIFAFAMPKQLAQMFSSDAEFVTYSVPMMRAGNAGAMFSWFKNNCQSCLQGMQRGILATVLAVSTQLVSMVGFTALLYYTDPHDPRRLQYAYPMSFGFAFVVCVIVLIKPVRTFLKSEKIDEEVEDGKELTNFENGQDGDLDIQNDIDNVSDHPELSQL